ncbi:MAG: biotin-dependent carboxyltransferase family protein [Chitinophagaceae bacterium]|nr:biotin-dependent carboxyltransferase family protein [Chitinophagaceae bacterium]
MSIRIIKPGLLATVQDGGRRGYQSLGVPVGGAMDEFAMHIANLLAGNAITDAVIEFTLHGAEVLFEKDMLISLSGGGATAFIDDMEIPYNKAIWVKAFTLIKFKSSSSGCRTYMAVAGGWDVPELMKSRSTYLPASIGGFSGRALQSCDVLKSKENKTTLSKNISKSLYSGDALFKAANWGLFLKHIPGYNNKTIRFFKGSEWNWFTETSHRLFLNNNFLVTGQSNRMGYRLKSEALQLINKRELLSTAVTRGTVQVTPDGNAALLMADAQTTGGYPRIAQVAAVDLSVCAQLKPGENIRFKEISIDEAEHLLLEREKELREIHHHLTLRFG